MSCPICNQPTATPWRPFCSRRCADIDLGKWLTGSYVLPDTAVEDEDSIPAQLPQPPKPH